MRRIAVLWATVACSNTPVVPDASIGPVVERTCPMNCGPTGDGDCCESPVVPGGTFFRDYDAGADGKFPDMSHPATLGAFRLDKYEVTVGRFRAFVEAGMGTSQCPPAAGAGEHAQIPGSGWDETWKGDLFRDTAQLANSLTCSPVQATWTDAPGANENLPINCVSWTTAMAFCIWDGGYLPTAAEWSYAATGGEEQRAFPWSQPSEALDADCTQASYRRTIGACSAITPVGSKPAGDGRWGHADLAGNVWEMVLDWTTLSFAPTYIDPCVDCARLTPLSPTFLLREVRGGGFTSATVRLRAANRTGVETTLIDVGIGFRCARSGP
ncbi:MAG: SUMF1/EgtB/PvdO family nonheme iron enzyme [Deltaproteobacteria bacterium]|nr:SUMF1/EgtB/PvdO family nonheme iron enzyme [Deltaproteobacteria bacterium]